MNYKYNKHYLKRIKKKKSRFWPIFIGSLILAIPVISSWWGNYSRPPHLSTEDGVFIVLMHIIDENNKSLCNNNRYLESNDINKLFCGISIPVAYEYNLFYVGGQEKYHVYINPKKTNHGDQLRSYYLDEKEIVRAKDNPNKIQYKKGGKNWKALSKLPKHDEHLR